MIEFNEFSVLLLELNSPNYSLAIGSKNLYYFAQMYNPNIKIYQYLIIYIIPVSYKLISYLKENMKFNKRSIPYGEQQKAP